MSKFTADEILEMAARIETKGAKFYRKAAKIHLGARDLLTKIAGQEDQHFAVFAELRKKLTPSEKANDGIDLSGESELYLKAMVDGQAFDVNKDPADVLTGKESVKTVLDMAIQMEKDSIVFYLGLRDLVPPTFGKDRVDAIVQEEMKHIAWLSDQRAAAK